MTTRSQKCLRSVGSTICSRDARPPSTGELGERPEPRRQQRLDDALEPTREHGRQAAAADRDGDRRAIDDSRHDEGAKRLIVDDVAEAFRGGGRGCDGSVDSSVVGGRDDEPVRFERVGRIGARDVDDDAVGRELGEPLRQLRRDDRHGRLGLEQQRDATFGHHAAADDEDGAMLQIREQG